MILHPLTLGEVDLLTRALRSNVRVDPDEDTGAPLRLIRYAYLRHVSGFFWTASEIGKLRVLDPEALRCMAERARAEAAE